jgi:hypothetical protein
MALSNLSSSAVALIRVFENSYKDESAEKITVNVLVSKVAIFYEKFRTAMDYGSEETIPRRAIERILKRRLFLDKNPKSLAQDLVRELIWAGYFPNASVPESITDSVAKNIELYLELKNKVAEKKVIQKDALNSFIIDVLSCEILNTIHPNKEKNAVANFMFKNLKDSVKIDDDSEQNRDLQVYIAIRKNFAKDDIASLHYRLFRQIFGKLKEENLSEVVSGFNEGYKEIAKQLTYPKKERIYNHIKKITPPFLVLYEYLDHEKGEFKSHSIDDEKLKDKILHICDQKYSLISRNVRTAIIRSFIFILFTKAIFTILGEGTYQTIVLGGIVWTPILLNILIPPMIMLIVGLSIRMPGKDNSEAILTHVRSLLFEENPNLLPTLFLKVKPKESKTLTDYIFSLIWFFSIFLTFGFIWFLLNLLGFDIVSKFIFLFFIAIISFLSYRIYQTANNYTVVRKQSLLTPIFDFLFVPIVRLGRSLTEGISQINFLLILIDLMIEAPFKGIIGFFEQWFSFAARKREELE